MNDDIACLDKIFIKDLLLRCIIGINEFERREKQNVLINVILWVDLRDASKTDDMNKAVDYREINKKIIELVENSEFFLIEKLASKIGEVCLQHEGVMKVSVTVEKPGVLRYARSVGVEITMKKDEAR